MGEGEYCLKNMNTEDINNLELIRKFLTSFRDENYRKYNKNEILQNQAFSSVIMLLAYKIKELEKEGVKNDI